MVFITASECPAEITIRGDFATDRFTLDRYLAECARDL